MNIQKLKNIAKLMLLRLEEKATELNLSREDLFFKTAQNKILCLLKKYKSNKNPDQELSIKNFLIDAKKIVGSLHAAVEEAPSFC